ncbi:Uncharacterised protein [Mycobacteroides abscessus subsp. abscessus]|nr:Uncharacterised protein [Mycobacteroides abscessus subsp. abscessus]SKU10146.1 Uncharacterised protein [Mycobacteroides abscessus subsp. abscessus]
MAIAVTHMSANWRGLMARGTPLANPVVPEVRRVNLTGRRTGGGFGWC